MYRAAWPFVAGRNGKPPLSMKAFVRTVREIEHCDVIRAGIFADKSSYKNPREWTKQPLTTSDDATEAYIVEGIAESDT